MLNPQPRALFKIMSLSAFLLVGSHAALAQRPGATPAPNPAVRDATRPPGTETQNPSAPPATQPAPAQAPPGTQQQPAQSPPGTPNVVPKVVPQATATPTTDEAASQEPREPIFPGVDQKPLPPMPNMTRLGVTSDNTLTLSLTDAIKRALENNNDIEVARDDVRFAETQLRSLEGIYQPVFSITPQIDKRITPQQSSLGGSGRSGTTTNTTYSLSPALNKQFVRGGGNYTLSFANSHTNTSSTFSFINPYYSSNLSLTFTQPLLRNRSIDNTRRQIRTFSYKISLSQI